MRKIFKDTAAFILLVGGGMVIGSSDNGVQSSIATSKEHDLRTLAQHNHIFAPQLDGYADWYEHMNPRVKAYHNLVSTDDQTKTLAALKAGYRPL